MPIFHGSPIEPAPPPDPGDAARSLAALPDPRAILFDLDGTLVDTAPTRVAAWADTFAEFGVPVERAALGAMIGMDGRQLARDVVEAAGRPVDDDLAEAIDHRAGELYDGLNVRPRPLPAAAELLTALSAAAARHAIVTSSRAGQVLVSVDALDLPSRPTIVDGSHVERAKPAPDALLLAARQLGVEPASCWYVGDAVWDMRAGRAAGMHGVGVMTGFAGVEDLVDAGAGAVIPSLWPLLEELRRRGLLSPGASAAG